MRISSFKIVHLARPEEEPDSHELVSLSCFGVKRSALWQLLGVLLLPLDGMLINRRSARSISNSSPVPISIRLSVLPGASKVGRLRSQNDGWYTCAHEDFLNGCLD